MKVDFDKGLSELFERYAAVIEEWFTRHERIQNETTVIGDNNDQTLQRVYKREGALILLASLRDDLERVYDRRR